MLVASLGCAALLACGTVEAARKKAPRPAARADETTLSPDGIPAGQPETLPAGDENATDAAAPAVAPVEPGPAPAPGRPMGDPGDLPIKAVRWRQRGVGGSKNVKAPARVRGAEAALEPDPSSLQAQGIYKAPGTEVHVTGDATNPLGGTIVEVVGHVKLERRGMVLSSDRLRFDKTKGEFVATGNVVVADPHYTLSCGRLVFYGAQEMGVAWESPRIMEVRRGPEGEIAERMEMAAFQITIYSNESRVEGLERVRIYRMARRLGKLDLDFKVTADSCDSNMINHESVFKGQVKVESPTYTVEARRLIFDQSADRFTAIGDAKVTGFGPKGEVTSTVEGNKIVHLIREHRSIVVGSVAASLTPGKPQGMRILDAAAVKDSTPSEELLSLPAPPKDPEQTKYRGKGK